MSLKAFHVIFVVASILMSLGFGIWAIVQYRAGSASTLELGLGMGSIAAGFALIIYGKYFLRKLKHISYL